MVVSQRPDCVEGKITQKSKSGCVGYAKNHSFEIIYLFLSRDHYLLKQTTLFQL
jgi:hypothetical protein